MKRSDNRGDALQAQLLRCWSVVEPQYAPILLSYKVAIGKFMNLFISILSSQSKRLAASTECGRADGEYSWFQRNRTTVSKIGSTCIGRLLWKNRGTLLVSFDFLRPGMVFVELVTGA